MESHALIKLPWDEIFGPAEQQSGGSAPRPRVEEVKAEPTQATTRRARSAAKEEPTQPVYPPGTPTLPCDACGATMAEHEDTCWKCGAKYELDDEPKPPAKPAKVEAKPAQKWAGESDDDDQLGW
jgi:hypothetical protein